MSGHNHSQYGSPLLAPSPYHQNINQNDSWNDGNGNGSWTAPFFQIDNWNRKGNSNRMHNQELESFMRPE